MRAVRPCAATPTSADTDRRRRRGVRAADPTKQKVPVPCLVVYHNYDTRFPRKESHMYGVLNEIYL